ncbi:MAG: diacylglycerol/lipid kinase family protein [Bryobacteraceae bacterium]
MRGTRVAFGRRENGTGFHIHYKNAFLIYNPAAGKVRSGGDRFVGRMIDQLRSAGIRPTVRVSRGIGTIPEVTSECVGKGADLVLACGGDGTINEVAEGLLGTGVPLGILPAGTANVLACELGFGSNLARAINRLGECRPHEISVGRLTNSLGSRHFLLMAGVGLDAFIVYRVSAQLKRRLGKVAYWMAGFSQVFSDLEEFDVEIDGRRQRCSFALVTKVRNYGGDLEIARGIRITDDRFEVVLFEGPSSFRYLKYFLGVATGRLEGMSGVTVTRARCASFHPLNGRSICMQIDGEYAGKAPGEVRIVPAALRLLIPPEYGAAS